MNSNPSSSRPRFTCRVVRLWSALSGAAESRHVSRCADCQEYFNAVQLLGVALRRDALQSTPVMSPGFERRILNSVRTSTEDPEAPPPRGFRYLVPAGAGGLAVAALAMMVTWSNRATHPEITREDARAVVSAVQTLSSQLVDTVIPSTADFVAL